uniref:Growth arrest specific 8 n=1 Tax=Rousettus aegyptiacus TaxID=9407 RepID=A0A7J8EK58_ROUAE|nr:growth arrest specific 8 [Rousettus aegyptiacus]
MAPKKKGKKGKGKGTPIVDGLTPEDMSKEQVEEHISRIREELDREREERNYFQLERDKIHTFWEITRRQLEEKKAELRNKDREMEEAEERHQVEIKVYKQKVKHLLYEHQNSLTEMKAEGTVVMKLAQKEHRSQEGALRKDMRALKAELKEQELAGEVVVKNLRLAETVCRQLSLTGIWESSIPSQTSHRSQRERESRTFKHRAVLPGRSTRRAGSQ